MIFTGKAMIPFAMLATVHAHMAISLINGAETITARDKASLNDAYRNPTAKACHGTAAGGLQLTVDANTKVSAKTTFGAGHDGGHCAWFISEDQKTWYKLNDKLDCTKGGQNQPHDVTIPANVPVSCGTKCILGWFWTPRSSGGCEIYSDCFDIKVVGAAGGIEATAPSITDPLTCKRIDGTGATTIYGPLMISNDGSVPAGSGGTAAPAPGPDDTSVESDGCTKYTVKAGDTLSAIATRFDIDKWETIQELNKLQNPDALEVGQVLLMPGDCDSRAGENEGNGDEDVNGAFFLSGAWITGVLAAMCA
jgi:LysM repeat protein